MSDEFNAVTDEELNDPDILIDEPVPAPKPIKPRKVTATIKILNMDQIDGNYLVYEPSTKQAYLVPAEHLTWSVGEQQIDRSILEKAIRPYDWSAEIESLMPSIEDVRLVIWSNGFLSKDDVANPTQARNALLGAFPSRLV